MIRVNACKTYHKHSINASHYRGQLPATFINEVSSAPLSSTELRDFLNRRQTHPTRECKMKPLDLQTGLIFLTPPESISSYSPMFWGGKEWCLSFSLPYGKQFLHVFPLFPSVLLSGDDFVDILGLSPPQCWFYLASPQQLLVPSSMPLTILGPSEEEAGWEDSLSALQRSYWWSYLGTFNALSRKILGLLLKFLISISKG